MCIRDRIATNIVEVRDGSVKNYMGDYDAYLYYINREIEEGERENQSSNRATLPPAEKLKAKTERKLSQNDERDRKKKIKALERKIAKLDEEKKALDQQMLTMTDPDEAMKLYNQIEAIGGQLASAEEEWLELN